MPLESVACNQHGPSGQGKHFQNGNVAHFLSTTLVTHCAAASVEDILRVSGSHPRHHEVSCMIFACPGDNIIDMRRFLSGLKSDLELAGRSAVEQAQVDAWLDFSVNEVEGLVHILGNELAGFTPAQVKKARHAAETKLSTPLQRLSTALASRTFLVGERLSIADIALCVVLSTAESAVSIDSAKLPALWRWLQTVKASPELAGLLSGLPAPAAAKATSSTTVASNATATPIEAGSALFAPTRITELFKRRRQPIRAVLQQGKTLVGQTVTVCGWSRTTRVQGAGSLIFISLSDGSCFESLQCVSKWSNAK